MDTQYFFTHQCFDKVLSALPYSERLKSEVEQNLLPFLTLPFFENLCKEIEDLRPFFSQYRHLLLLGIGGSALGARALQRAFAPGQDRPSHNGKSLWIMDNIDPEAFEDTLDKLPKEDTLVVTISKSGGTIETISQYFIVKEKFQEKFPDTWNEHFLHITDKYKGFLRQEVNTYKLKSLEVPDNLGGRYSVLSAVGMLPAAFLDINYQGILQGAADLGRNLAKDFSQLENHVAWKLANWAYQLLENKYSQLIFFMYHPAWATFGPWFAQLWAESIGKEGKGSMPISALGVTDQHSLLQMFLDGPKDKGCIFISSKPLMGKPLLPSELPKEWEFIQSKSLGEVLAAETLGTHMALVEHKVPLVHIEYPNADAYEAGEMMQLLELTTILTGWLLKINPIDQPAVEYGKVLANAKLGSEKHSQYTEKLNNFKK